MKQFWGILAIMLLLGSALTLAESGSDRGTTSKSDDDQEDDKTRGLDDNKIEIEDKDEIELEDETEEETEIEDDDIKERVIIDCILGYHPAYTKDEKGNVKGKCVPDELVAVREKRVQCEDIVKRVELQKQLREQTENKTAREQLELRIKESEKQRELCKENLGQLVSTAVKLSEGSAKDIVAYYKEELDTIKSEEDPTVRLEKLKTLRSEIDKTIEEIITARSSISVTELSPVVDRIEFRKEKITAGDTEIEAENKTFSTGKFDIVVGKEKLKLRQSDGTEIEVESELTYEGDILKAGNQELKITPQEAKAKVRYKIREMKLIQGKEKTSYDITGEEERKVLGFIKATANSETSVDPTSGEIVAEKSSWWKFLSTRSESTTEPAE